MFGLGIMYGKHRMVEIIRTIEKKTHPSISKVFWMI